MQAVFQVRTSSLSDQGPARSALDRPIVRRLALRFDWGPDPCQNRLVIFVAVATDQFLMGAKCCHPSPDFFAQAGVTHGRKGDGERFDTRRGLGGRIDRRRFKPGIFNCGIFNSGIFKPGPACGALALTDRANAMVCAIRRSCSCFQFMVNPQPAAITAKSRPSIKRRAFALRGKAFKSGG